MQADSALDLFLWSQVAVVTALSLSAVGGLWRETSVALSANHFLALEFSGQSSKGWFDLDLTHTATSKS